MIAVIFELEPREGATDRYFELAAELRPALEGFISVERFESVATKGRYLSLSFWRDEAAVRAWRCHGMRRGAQREGRSSVLASYRLRVSGVVCDYGLLDRREVPNDSLSAPM
jgi:heme-degrading monooxygenase HmoA